MDSGKTQFSSGRDATSPFPMDTSYHLPRTSTSTSTTSHRMEEEGENSFQDEERREKMENRKKVKGKEARVQGEAEKEVKMRIDATLIVQSKNKKKCTAVINLRIDVPSLDVRVMYCNTNVVRYLNSTSRCIFRTSSLHPGLCGFVGEL